MTNVPECQLAREAEICYATISMVTNFAAGISPTALTHKEVIDCMNQNIESFRRIITVLSASYDSDADCACRHAAKILEDFSCETSSSGAFLGRDSADPSRSDKTASEIVHIRCEITGRSRKPSNTGSARRTGNRSGSGLRCGAGVPGSEKDN